MFFPSLLKKASAIHAEAFSGNSPRRKHAQALILAFLFGVKPMSKFEEIFKREGKILNSTGKAVLFEIDSKEVWIPLSQLYDPHELYNTNELGEADSFTLRRGESVEVKMTEWIAKRVGLL